MVEDIEDCVSPGDVGSAGRAHRSKYILPRGLRKRKSKGEDGLNARTARPEADSFIPGTQSVYVKTWGCSHNTSDGEYMAGLLAAAGYSITGVRSFLLQFASLPPSLPFSFLISDEIHVFYFSSLPPSLPLRLSPLV